MQNNESLDRILRERLSQFSVPAEVQHALRDDILAFFQRPDKKPHGAAILTPEASMAADIARKAGQVQQPGTPVPKIV